MFFTLIFAETGKFVRRFILVVLYFVCLDVNALRMYLPAHCSQSQLFSQKRAFGSDPALIRILHTQKNKSVHFPDFVLHFATLHLYNTLYFRRTSLLRFLGPV
jgi:hypothetical protein